MSEYADLKERMQSRADSGGYYSDWWQESLVAILALEVQVKELREALEPFKQAAEDCLDPDRDRDGSHLWESPAAMQLTAGDLRRGALAAQEPK